MTKVHQTRRTFLSGAATGSLLLLGTRAAGAVKGANDRVRIAVVGCNGRGQAHLKGWLGTNDVEVAYVVDPDSTVLARTLAGLEKKRSGKAMPVGVADFRRVLDDPSVDAISIAAPNHWHSLMTIRAAQAGKHVYVEKHEGRRGRSRGWHVLSTGADADIRSGHGAAHG